MTRKCSSTESRPFLRFGVMCHQYVVHTFLFFSSESDKIVDVLNNCLYAVMGQLRANKLTLDLDKMEVLLIINRLKDSARS